MKQLVASRFFFSLDSITPQETTEGGSLTHVTGLEVPGFINISFANLHLKGRGILEPIWHPNAHKVGYCIQGKVLVTMRTPEKAETFTVEKGEIFFIPQGYVHSIENLGEKESTIKFALNHTKPEVMCLSEALCSISGSVFNSTFNTASGFVEGLKKGESDELITTLSQSTRVAGAMGSKFKYNIGSSEKPILTQGGYLQLGIKKNLPVLEGLGILGFGLNPKGAVEPHWHTNAGELVYIVKGQTRITVLSPDGQVDVQEVSDGQGIFAPASHFHNIENIGHEAVEVIAFFSHAEPDYIGIGEVVGSCSNELLASVFNVPLTYFSSLKKPEGPLVIVPI